MEIQKKLMIRLFFTYSTLVLASTFCFGQGYLLLRNKSVVAYQKLKKSLVTKADGSQLKIDFNEVDGDITSNKKDFKRMVFNDSSTFGWAQRIQDGKINLYERIDYVGSGANSTKIVSLYLEKEAIFKKIYSSEIFYNNKKRIDDLKSFFDDSPDLLEIISSPDFKNKHDNIVKIVGKYNLEKFDPNDNPYGLIPITGTRPVTVIFYNNEEVEKDSYITVNGEGHYNFKGYGPAYVPLPILKPCKVCLISPSRQFCEIFVSGLDVSYYEISPEDQLLNAELRTNDFAQRAIAFNKSKH